jgi:hypothetical protein
LRPYDEIEPVRRWILHFHDGMKTTLECADERVVPTKGRENYKTATATLEFNAAAEFEFFDRNQIPRAAA